MALSTSGTLVTIMGLVLLILVYFHDEENHETGYKSRTATTTTTTDNTELEERNEGTHMEKHHHREIPAELQAYSIEPLSWSPRVFLIRGLASPEDCAEIIKSNEHKLSRSRVASDKNEDVNSVRTSYGAFLRTRGDSILEGIEQRIAEITHLPRPNQEAFYLLRYEKGQQYKPHYDFFDPQYYEASRWIGSRGQRCATVLLYLNHPEEGGETIFPRKNLSVMPDIGDAVLFYDTHPNSTLDYMSLHGGSPVEKGQKWVMTKWIREHKF